MKQINKIPNITIKFVFWIKMFEYKVDYNSSNTQEDGWDKERV